MAQNQDTKYTLNCPWTVRFMVKQRKQEGGKAYGYQDFVDSFLPIGTESTDLDTIMKTINLVPSFEKRLRGIITVFRDGIQPAYEDNKNKGGKIVRFSFSTKAESTHEAVKAFEEAKEKADADTKNRKIAPVLEKCDDFVHFFIIFGLCGGFDSEHGKLNGFYIKTEFDVICLDAWFSTVEAGDENRNKIQQMLEQVDPFCKVLIQGPTPSEKRISDTIQTIDMKEKNVRGKSQFTDKNKGGKGNYDRNDRKDDRSERGERGDRDRSQRSERDGQRDNSSFKKYK
ncbi:Eukaryotic_translation initiation factor 4E [Hexamita inflata]|uniref:Eukaryotic translation initiation factor 4E n=1 Tax=Hexamita inflata TaxID=28002 RepID=A0AA86NZR8_9EUKA|nr:Eukaryotic translation initiation factor 4E [Hexamita inflata]